MAIAVFEFKRKRLLLRRKIDLPDLFAVGSQREFRIENTDAILHAHGFAAALRAVGQKLVLLNFSRLNFYI